MELKDYLRILRRNAFTFLLVTGLVVAGNFWVLGRQPQVYQARAQLILKEPQTPWVVYTAAATPTVWATLTQATRLTLIESEPVLRRAVQSLAKYYPLPASAFVKKEGEKSRIPAPEAAALYDAMDALRRVLDVESAKETEIVAVSARDRDPEFVRDACNEVALAFAEYIDVEARRRLDDTLVFLAEQEGTRRTQVDALLAEMEKHRGVLESRPGPPDVSEFVGELVSLRAAQADLEVRLGGLRAAAAPLQKALEQGVPLIADLGPEEAPPPPSAGASELARMQAELDTLLLRYTEAHPRVQDLCSRLDAQRAAEERLAAEQERRREDRASARTDRAKKVEHDRLVGLKTEIAELEKRREAGAKEIEGLRGRIAETRKPTGPLAEELLRARQQSEQLGYQLEIARRSLSFAIDRRADLDLQKNLQAPTVQIVSPAKLGAPIAKTGAGSWVFVVLIGVMVGIASAYFRDYLNGTIRSEHDVRRYLNLPVMGSVVRLGRGEPRLLLDVSPRSPLQEMFHTIGALLESFASENQAKLFTVASSRPEEGKSTVSSNVAISLARSGERVVLVDCDLRRPALHKFFSLDNGMGISGLAERSGSGSVDVPLDLLRGALLPTAVANLRVLPSGPTHPNPVGLLKSPFFGALLRALREEADVVLIDVPPTNLAVDTMLVAPRVDGVVLLVAVGEATKDEVTYAKRLIESARGRFVGCVLNKVTQDTHGYYYYPYAGKATKEHHES